MNHINYFGHKMELMLLSSQKGKNRLNFNGHQIAKNEWI